MSVKTSQPFQRDVRMPLLEHQEMTEPLRGERMPAPAHGLTRSFRFAMDGILHTLRTQRNFRIQVACALLTIGAAAALRISHLEWIVVVAMIAVVLSLELVNTAAEAVVDMITIDYHPLAKVAKDSAAAAVLVASGISAVVAGIIFVPYVLRFLGK